MKHETAAANYYIVSINSCMFRNLPKRKEEESLPKSAGLKIDTISFKRSMKGWELYSRPEGNLWTYSFLIGTNTLKTLSQVKNNPIRVVGEDSLKSILNKLPSGEEIMWIGQQWLNETWSSDYGNLKLPPRSIQIEIKEFCDTKNLKLTIAE